MASKYKKIMDDIAANSPDYQAAKDHNNLVKQTVKLQKIKPDFMPNGQYSVTYECLAGDHEQCPGRVYCKCRCHQE